MTWRDISTAPKDGTPIWATDGVHAARVVRRGPEWECLDWHGIPTGTGFYPTRWAPLPGSSTPDEAQRSEPARSALQAPSLSVGEEKLREAWPDDVLDRVEMWINAKRGGEATVRDIASALLSALSTDVGDGRLCTAERASSLRCAPADDGSKLEGER